MTTKGHLIGKATCALYHRVSTRDQNQKLARRELRQARQPGGYGSRWTSRRREVAL
jgi:DNA invertase Pin-like site-specific DNA recombinase